MPTFTHDRTVYHYQITGDGAPLLLLHGFTGSAQSWAPFIPWLARFHRVITVDLPGHGCTVAPDSPAYHTMEQTAAGMAAFINQIVAEPVHLLGYSMGGRLALYFAQHYPVLVRSLLLESASPGLTTDEERAARRTRDEALAARIERDGIPAFIDFWETIPLFASQAKVSDSVRTRLRAQRLRNRVGGLANSLRGMGTGAQASLWDQLAKIATPTLVLAGAADAKFVTIAGEMNEQLPNSQIAIIPGAGHTIHLERPHAFTRHVLTWLYTNQPIT